MRRNYEWPVLNEDLGLFEIEELYGLRESEPRHPSGFRERVVRDFEEHPVRDIALSTVAFTGLGVVTQGVRTIISRHHH